MRLLVKKRNALTLVIRKSASRLPFKHQSYALQDPRFEYQNLELLWEMRLGKTFIAVRWCLSKNPSKILVLAPFSALGGWEKEIKLSSPSAKAGIESLYLIKSSKKRLQTVRQPKPEKTWFLLNYEGLRANPSLADLPWDAVVLDESTTIKAPSSQITRLVRDRLAHVPHRAILSGLPNPESPLDFFEQMAFTRNGFFLGCKNWYQFRHRYFFRADQFSWEPRPGAIRSIKETVHAKAYVLTRQQAKMGPETVYETRQVELGPEARKIYREAKSKFIVRFPDSSILKSTKWAVVVQNWLMRICGGFLPPNSDGEVSPIDMAKRKELLYLLQNELSQEPVVVWFNFNAELEAVRTDLNKHKISYSYIHGSIKPSERKTRSDQFQDGKFRVFLLQMACARFGLDLSVSDTAIYYSNTLRFENRYQSQDRIVHMKKTNPVLCLDLVYRKTVDEHVAMLLKNKRLTSRIFMQKIWEHLHAA
jgi:SNF2 family DNA or RNA helicase